MVTCHLVYFGKIGWLDDTPVSKLGKLAVGAATDGPAVVADGIDDMQTPVVPGTRAVSTSWHIATALKELL